MSKLIALLIGLILVSATSAVGALAASQAQQALWQALRSGGYVVMLRHARTEPGVGDPPNFTIGDCRTQRNLSPAGQADARRIGTAFRRYEVPIDAVLSSQWCRCMDTAKLAFGRVQPHATLNSMFTAGAENQRAALEQTSRLIGGHAGDGNLILVTHAVNIHAVTGLYPASGEMVVLRGGAGGIEVVGLLELPATQSAP